MRIATLLKSLKLSIDAPSASSGAPGGMTRFGSLSVKVKKTTEAVKAFNSYFNSKMGSDSADSASSSQPSSLGPISLPMDFVHTSGQSAIKTSKTRFYKLPAEEIS